MLTVWLAENSSADYTAAHTYSLVLSIGEGTNTVEKAVTVKTLKTPENSTAVTMTAKAAGGIDTVLAGSPVTLTLSLKNYHGTPDQVAFYPTVMLTPAKTKDITAAAGAELDYTWTYSAVVKAEGTGLEATVKKLAIRMGAAKVEQSTREIRLLSRDRYSEGLVSISTADGELGDIRKVVFADSNDPISKDGFFELSELGAGTWSIGYAGNEITTTKNTTVKLNVFFDGNLSTKPNATVSIKISFA